MKVKIENARLFAKHLDTLDYLQGLDMPGTKPIYTIDLFNKLRRFETRLQRLAELNANGKFPLSEFRKIETETRSKILLLLPMVHPAELITCGDPRGFQVVLSEEYTYSLYDAGWVMSKSYGGNYILAPDNL